jgi:hypothetical protein
MHQRGQQRHQQGRVGRVEHEVAAQQPHVGPAAARAVAHLAAEARLAELGMGAGASSQ